MCHSSLLKGQRHSEQLGGRAPSWAGIKVTAVLVQGYAWAEDKEHCEEYGRMLSADPTRVSQRAKKRGLPQVCTLSAPAAPREKSQLHESSVCVRSNSLCIYLFAEACYGQESQI
jgi:hypothetical protein